MEKEKNSEEFVSEDNGCACCRKSLNSEEFVSEDNGCACCRTSLKAELLERADRLSVEVSVLSLREGRSRRLYLCCGTKNEPVVSCDGVYSDVLSKRLDSDVEGFRRSFSGG